jgi:hypothetical protein
MRTGTSLKTAGGVLLILGAGVLLAACGGSGGGSGDGGSVSFSLVLREDAAVAGTGARTLAQFPCEGQDIDTIEAELLKNDVTEAEGGPFACEDGEGSIEDVPPGRGYTLAVFARNAAGEAIFSGEVDGLRIIAGQTTEAGEVILTRIRNRPPVLAAISDQSLLPGGQVAINLSATDLDAGDALSFAAGLNDDVENPFQVQLQDNGDGTAVCTLTAGAEAPAGTYSFLFTVTDDGVLEPGVLSDSQSVAVTVGTVVLNQAPVLTPIGDQSVFYGNPIVIPVTATDPDGDPLSYAAVWLEAEGDELPGNADFGQDEGGAWVFTWTPLLESDLGTKTFRFTVTDQSALPPGPLSDSEDVRISVVFEPD